jgi:methyl-accepting chemotaxis protein
MKWNVGTKIGVGYGLALAILIVIGSVSYLNTTKLIQAAEARQHTHRVLQNLAGVVQALTNAETGQRGFIITGEEPYLEPYQVGLSAIDQDLKEVRNLTRDNPNQQRRLDALEPRITERLARLKAGIEIRKSKDFEAAREWIVSGRGKEVMDEIRKVVAEMEQEENDLLKKRSEEAQASARQATFTILFGTLSALGILAVASFLITRNIAGPLKEISVVAERIAAGDLTGGLFSNHRRDEVGVLAHTFTRMTQSLRDMAGVAETIAAGDLRVKVNPQSEKDVLGNAFVSMVGNLRKLTTDIAEAVTVMGSATNEISTSTSQLAAGASQTATAVTETTSTVEEVKQTAQVSSQKAKSVSESAQKAVQISQNGKKATEEASEGMNRIRQQMEAIAESMVRLSEQTQAIGQIIATVDDLAAQSNLLAVNASIEAAKAGEQGKGFAVVAQEVKSLAEQSKQATTQVRAILNDIQKATSAAAMATEQGTKAVELGGKQSAQAGESIQVLSASVAEAAQAATQIAASNQQQLVGVDQVASAMESIKQASTQNVDSAKQLEVAAHNLNELGQKLKQLVAQYKV